MKPFALVLLAGLLALAAILMLRQDEPVFETNPGTVPAVEDSTSIGAAVADADGSRGDGVAAEAADQRRDKIDATSIRVAGRLVQEGKGLAGVRVALFFGKGTQWSPFGVQSPEKVPDRTADTDGSGSFEFSIPAGKPGRLTLPEADQVWSSRQAPHFLPSSEDLDLGLLELKPGAVLVGRVVDEGNTPIADAKLLSYNYGIGMAARRPTKTDAGGRFEMRGLSGGNSGLMVSCEGFSCRSLTLDLVEGEHRRDITITLRRGETLIGEVVDDRSKPLAGVTIQTSGQGKGLPDGYEYTNTKSETDGKGVFRAGGMVHGPFQIAATLKGYVPASKANFTLDAGSPRLVLLRMATVSGTLVDEAGLPLAGSSVYATRKDPNPTPGRESSRSSEFSNWNHSQVPGKSGRTKTADDGTFTVANVEPNKPVWLVAEGKHLKAVLGPLKLDPGEAREGLTITASVGVRISVRVLDPQGGPIEGARVRLRAEKKPSASASNPTSRPLPRVLLDLPQVASNPGSSVVTAVTDDEGHCELRGAKPGAYALTGTHKDWVRPDAQSILVPDKGQVSAEITMVAGGRVDLRVVDQEGHPVANQSFQILHRTADAESAAVAGAKKKKPKQAGAGKTDAAGRAKVGPLPVGEYVAELRPISKQNPMMRYMIGNISSSSGRKDSLGEPVSFQVVADRTAEVQLLLPPLASLVGTVHDESGPVVNGTLVLSPRSEKDTGSANSYRHLMQASTVRTDQEGRFRFVGLSVGGYTLSVKRNKAGLAYVEPIEIRDLTEHRRDLVLNPGSLEIQVLVEGKPKAGIKLTLRSQQSSQFTDMIGSPGGSATSAKDRKTAETDAKGRARFDSVPPGEYGVAVHGADYQQPSARIEVRAATGEKAELRLELAAVLTLHATEADGSRVKGNFQIELTREGTTKPQRMWHQGGEKKISGLVPGRYRVRVIRMGKNAGGQKPVWSEAQQVELAAGKSSVVKIILP